MNAQCGLLVNSSRAIIYADTTENFAAAAAKAAREVRDELKSTSSSAGVSVAGVGSVNLPLGTSGASLVKVGEQTITDSEFYGRFFALMQTFIR